MTVPQGSSLDEKPSGRLLSHGATGPDAGISHPAGGTLLRETMNVSDVYQYGTQHFGTTQAADALERSNSPRMKTRSARLAVRLHGLGGLQDRRRSPHDSLHGLYRTLILAHGESVTSSQKRCFTRKYGHAASLLIMVCF